MTTRFSQRTLNAAAARGARYLDRKHPGWASKIDLNTLQMSQSQCCILGQRFGDFWNALGDLRLSERQAASFGFTLSNQPAMNHSLNWDRLARAWAPLVAVRQLPRVDNQA